MEKRAQQSTLTLIIVIVLGIAVLVFLIFGFSTGWNNLWDKITNIGGGGKVNIDAVVTGCELACTTQKVNEFCDQKRTVHFGESVEVREAKVEKYALKDKGSLIEFIVLGDTENVKSIEKSCKELASADLGMIEVETNNLAEDELEVWEDTTKDGKGDTKTTLVDYYKPGKVKVKVAKYPSIPVASCPQLCR